MKRLGLILLLVLQVSALGQDESKAVRIDVDSGSRIGKYKPIWAYFGYDEPNYTYMRNGQKLVSELTRLSPVPVYFRAHNLLTTGDGKPALKWGSTNALTEDVTGKAVYDWTIVDQIIDTYVKNGGRPLVEIGFMPKALSAKPEPYQHHWKPGDNPNQLYLGWAFPPRDYAKWAELVRQWVIHSVERYGKQEVLNWYWELWNEPDISYWQGTPEEYNRLYDYTAMAVKQVLPDARIGGPATTGPGSEKAAAFLRQFLQHCENGVNAATGKVGAPLDFISFHAKGRPTLVDGNVQMGISKNLVDVAKGFEIVSSFNRYKGLPIILTESDPEGCAACSARVYPQNTYRNGTLYPSYTAVALNGIFQLADKYQVNIEGMQTWAFEFEDQPWFDGFRSLATNGVDKPILNLFRMAGLMGGERIKLTSSGAVSLEEILSRGVRGSADVNGFATRNQRDVSALIWNYHDDNLPAPGARVKLRVSGVPPGLDRVLVRHYRIDEEHSNAFTAWKRLGSPQSPDAQQVRQLETAGQLQEFTSPEWVLVKKGIVELEFDLPRQAVSLVQLSW